MLSGPFSDPCELPKWNYDGSSTGQAPGKDSEVILYPQTIFKDPFRRENNILVICDCYTPAGEPIPTNKRFNAAKIFSHPDVSAEAPWYGIEQEYTLLQKDIKWPIGWPVGRYPGSQLCQFYSYIDDHSFISDSPAFSEQDRRSTRSRDAWNSPKSQESQRDRSLIYTNYDVSCEEFGRATTASDFLS